MTVNLGGILSGSGKKYGKSQNVEVVDGIEWYQYMIPNERYYSLMDKVGANEIIKKFVICIAIPNAKDKNKPNRRFAAFDSVLDFLHYIKDVPRERWVFFEYIMGDQTQKPYFDIDVDVEKLVDLGIITIPENLDHCQYQLDLFTNQLISSLVGRIFTVFHQRNCPLDITKNILLFNSNSTTKRSYHLIVNGYAVSNCEENYNLAQEILEGFPDYVLKKKLIDPSMWASKQQFRLFQSQKPGSNRPKIFMNKWYYADQPIEYCFSKISAPDQIIYDNLQFSILFQASCVTYTENCKVISVVPTLESGRRYKFWKDVGSFDPDECIITDNIIDAICKRVNHKMFQVYKLERDKVTGPFIYLCRRRELLGTEVMCTLCNRTHKSNNAFLRVDKCGKVYFHCHATEGLSRNVADVSDLLPINKELENNQKQSILSQLVNRTQNGDGTPSALTLHNKMRIMASDSPRK
jgi:hypothetical protein